MNKIQKYIKIFLVSTLIIATTSMIFKGVTQIVMATKISKSESIATTYLSSSNLKSSNIETQKNYIKPNYKLVDVGKPTNSDITYEEAAEIGAKNLNSVFGLDMSDKVIEMAYYPEEYGKKARWAGSVCIDGKSSEVYIKPVESYSFSVYSSSGELCTLSHTRVLETKFDFEVDKELEQNSEEYKNLAKELSIKLGIIQGAVKTAEYYNQGGTLYGELEVSIKVTGENSAILTFSRYDKELIGICYNTRVKEIEAYNNRK